jgi:Brp/Blh family beta-carotene 15,15'-monooxygenase
MSLNLASTVAGSGALTGRAKRTFRRLVFWPAWLLLAVPIPAFLAGISLPPAVQAAPLAVSALFLGMPHGAVDHLVLPRTRGERPTLRSVGLVVVLYGVLGGAYTLGWFLAPAAAAVFFILLTWFHWGQGELFPLLAFTDADHLGSRLQRGLTLLVRGGLPMLVPLLGFPDAYRQVLGALVAPFAGPGYEGLAPLFRPEVRLALGLGFGALTLLTLGLGYLHSRQRRAWALDAFETGFLWVFFLTVPPVFAIGLYFCLWHSARHVARLLAVDDPARQAIRREEVTAALSRFARDAAPTTVAALLLFGGFFLVVPNPPQSLLGVAGLYLVLISVLTLPHVVIVTAMDRYQRVW